MNRWDVQFREHWRTFQVTAPTAADAIIIAASFARRDLKNEAFTVTEEDKRLPWRIEWLGPA